MVPLSQNTTLLLIHFANLHNNKAEWIMETAGLLKIGATLECQDCYGCQNLLLKDLKILTVFYN
jgi:hypothetical protein